ncbi:Os06g0483950 [Oryza sativa Japonica Group]|uniref:Os06g0483950 protein n=1 Tax=Oryza sativa subsp. japonica TaxID=39947 RepID=A0A0P0WWP7_ORYSJ|nr:Os06g0483950 [Oryza sativa Japonica Group]
MLKMGDQDEALPLRHHSEIVKMLHDDIGFCSTGEALGRGVHGGARPGRRCQGAVVGDGVAALGGVVAALGGGMVAPGGRGARRRRSSARSG